MCCKVLFFLASKSNRWSTYKFLLWWQFLVLPNVIFSINSTIPGAIESYATIHSIGIEWLLSGDDNHNATCQIQFKKTGTSVFHSAMELYRIDYLEYNMLAGSIFFLEPGTQYEISLALTDPDGGSSNQSIFVTTGEIPIEPTGGRTFHVAPGTGGGNGTESTPFLGIDAAEVIAQPGDIFLLHGGDYGGVVYFNAGGSVNNHIVWKAAGDGDPIFKGVRVEADYIWLEKLKIVDQQYGLRTSPPGPQGVVITHCQFINNHYSIYLNDGGDGWYISDNIIIGDNIPKTSNFSGEGIELWHTSNHTVCYNTISRVADGISYPHKNVDMFGNEIFDTSDDGIEFDYGHVNNRAWKNRISNLFNNGISFQPMDGAPSYVLYNQVAVLNSQSVLKLRDRSDRALIAHNTFVCNSGPMAFGSDLLVNCEIKNNLWISIQDRYAWENGNKTPINWKTDFDYDGFDWGNYVYAFKWGDRLVDIPEFYDSTGQELHGIRISHQSCFDSLEYDIDPADPTNVDSFFLQHYRIKSNCNAKDAGVYLPNINDGFIGSAPDLGAYELGVELPHYGVRSLCVNQEINHWVGPNNSSWWADPSYWSLNRFPELCDRVVIENGKSVLLLTGMMAHVYNLEVQAGAILNTESGSVLIVTNK